jgi:acylphosphatase
MAQGKLAVTWQQQVDSEAVEIWLSGCVKESDNLGELEVVLVGEVLRLERRG